jgi:hypothetical protein
LIFVNRIAAVPDEKGFGEVFYLLGGIVQTKLSYRNTVRKKRGKGEICPRD